MIALLETLKAHAEAQDSMFKRQLALEDAKRVEKLVEMAKSGAGREQYMKDGLFIGWTQGDMTTHRVQDEIKALMAEIYDACAEDGAGGDDARIEAAWDAFIEARLKRLIHCL